MAVSDYNATDSLNTIVPGSPPIELGEGIAPSPAMVQTLRRAIQRIMADLKALDGTFTGADGANGTSAGLEYSFSTSTSMANPGAGYLRLNDVLASATILAINEGTAASGNPDASAWINSWDDGTGGQLVIAELGAQQNFAIYDVGTVTDNTGWHSVTLTHVASSGSFGADDSLGIAYIKKGPTGAAGDDGASLIPKGAYAGGTAYVAGDVVTNQNSSWIALQATTGNAPPTLPTTVNAYWMLLAAKGDNYVVLTQAAYDALTPDANTVYFITD